MSVGVRYIHCFMMNPIRACDRTRGITLLTKCTTRVQYRSIQYTKEITGDVGQLTTGINGLDGNY